MVRGARFAVFAGSPPGVARIMAANMDAAPFDSIQLTKSRDAPPICRRICYMATVVGLPLPLYGVNHSVIVEI